MTPERADRLNRFLVEDVLGWRQFSKNHGFYWYPKEKRAVLLHGSELYTARLKMDLVCDDDLIVDFRTLKWCEPLLDKIERDGWVWDWCIASLFKGKYWFVIQNADEHFVVHSATRTEALCLAIAKAYGWKEE